MNFCSRETSDLRLTEHRRIWDLKPTLRSIYADYHDQLQRACPQGRLLDIGGGSAHFKYGRPDTISLDIISFPGIDVVGDAHSLPFADATFSGVVMLDVLHHLQRPVAFLREAARLLTPKGALVMIEPGMSVVSRHFYKSFHQEPVLMDADPFDERVVQSGEDPFDSNQAIPTLLFANENARRRVEAIVPGLRVAEVRWLALWAYPLSGGFKSWCLIPPSFVASLLKIERALLPLTGRFFGFRLFVKLVRL